MSTVSQHGLPEFDMIDRNCTFGLCIAEHFLNTRLLLANMTSKDIRYEALADQIESILGDSEGAIININNEALRRRLVNSSRKLSVALEQNRETLRRIGYAVCLILSSH
jgi:hypothetical protein